MPALGVRNAGSPTDRAGFVSRFRRRSERTQTIVIAGADHLHRQRDGRPLEVGAGERQARVRQEDRVVADAVELDLDLLPRPCDGVVRGADHLRRRAHRVGVLDLGLHAAGQQVAARPGPPDRTARTGSRPGSRAARGAGRRTASCSRSAPRGVIAAAISAWRSQRSMSHSRSALIAVSTFEPLIVASPSRASQAGRRDAGALHRDVGPAAARPRTRPRPRP